MADEFARATERIYFAAQRWSGAWRLAILPAGGEGQARGAAPGRLWPLAPGVLIAPLGADGRPIRAASRPGAAVLLDATGAPAEGRTLAARAGTSIFWPRATRRSSPLSPRSRRPRLRCRGGGLEALMIRIRLVHAYRRIALKDPLLPGELLPAGWPGHEARRVCAAIYRRVREPSERWLDGMVPARKVRCRPRPEPPASLRRGVRGV